MRNVSSEFKNTMEERNDFYYEAEITFSNGEVVTVSKEDLILSGNSVIESSDANSFPLGFAIGKRINLGIKNYDERFSEYDFYNAIIYLRLKFDLSETTEIVNLGKYTIREPEVYGNVITITATDDMYKADTDYTGNVFPITVKDALINCCDSCGLTLLDANFKNNDFVIQNKPSEITNRQFIGMCAMLAGGNALIDEYGRLKIVTYDLSAFERNGNYSGGIFDNYSDNEANIDGGGFFEWASGDAIEGGTFNYEEITQDYDGGSLLTGYYASGDRLNGGIFSPWEINPVYSGGTFSEQNNFHVFYKAKNFTIATDDVIVTGVKVIVDNKEYLFGSDGYVLEIQNQLITGSEEEAIERIGNCIVGLQFRPFTIDHVCYPLAEFGDLCYLIDNKNRVYQSVITDIDFAFRGYTVIKCVADSPLRNSSKYYSNAETKAVVSSRNEAKKEVTQYDKAVQMMTTIIASSMGMFTTYERTENGGFIAYQHNKPKLSESNIIWKQTENGFVVSNDYGETWNAGIDADGNAVVNVLSAIGINFDWARGGTITLGGVLNGNGKLIILDASGTQVGYVDNTGVNFQKGTFSGTVSAARIEGSNISGGQIVSAKNNNVNGQKIVVENSTMSFYMPGYSWYLDKELYYAGSLYPSENNNNAWEDDSLLEEQLPVIKMDTEYGYELYVSDELIFSAVLDPQVKDTDRMQLIDTCFHDFVWFKDSIYVDVDLDVGGAKSRLVKDTAFGDILLYCQESATPYFTDIGTGIINDNGECTIAIDSVFLETINSNVEYSVFLQKEGPGDLWISEKEFMYFTVKGTPGIKFSWEIKAVQNGYEAYRLEDKTLKSNVSNNDASIELDKILNQEEITYADFEGFSDY